MGNVKLLIVDLRTEVEQKHAGLESRMCLICCGDTRISFICLAGSVSSMCFTQNEHQRPIIVITHHSLGGSKAFYCFHLAEAFGAARVTLETHLLAVQMFCTYWPLFSDHSPKVCAVISSLVPENPPQTLTMCH